MILALVIQHTVTISLKFRVGHLLPEFLTDALVFFRPLEPAGAVAAGALEAVPDGLDHFLVGVQCDCHNAHPFVFSTV